MQYVRVSNKILIKMLMWLGTVAWDQSPFLGWWYKISSSLHCNQSSWGWWFPLTNTPTQSGWRVNCSPKPMWAEGGTLLPPPCTAGGRVPQSHCLQMGVGREGSHACPSHPVQAQEGKGLGAFHSHAQTCPHPADLIDTLHYPSPSQGGNGVTPSITREGFYVPSSPSSTSEGGGEVLPTSLMGHGKSLFFRSC